jgi:hypothetical protein
VIQNDGRVERQAIGYASATFLDSFCHGAPPAPSSKRTGLEQRLSHLLAGGRRPE